MLSWKPYDKYGKSHEDYGSIADDDGGVSMNRAGRFYNTQTGRYVKTPNPGMSPATSLIGGVVGGTVANQAGKQAAKTVATRSLASVGGRLLGLIGGPWGLAITVGLPLLIEVGSRLIDSVDRNTNAQDKGKEDSTTIRAQNEERFINAVRLAIKEGMRDSRINISVDGQAVGIMPQVLNKILLGPHL